MLKQLNPDQTILALDIGEYHTRALLFEIVEGKYQFIAVGQATTTEVPPESNINEGVYQALIDLQRIVTRRLLDEGNRLVIPINKDGVGIDKLVACYHLGEPLAIGMIGLLEDADLSSGQKLVNADHAHTVQVLSLWDDRPVQSQVDAMLYAKPDILLLTGGYDDGAARAPGRNAELALLICRLLPEYKRPQVIYAGNDRLAQRAVEVLQKWTRIKTVTNMAAGPGKERLMPAIQAIGNISQERHLRTVSGLKQLSRATSVPPKPATQTFGQMIRYLSKIYDPVKGVAGVLLSPDATTMTRAVEGELVSRRFKQGLTNPVVKPNTLQRVIDETMQWLAVDVPTDAIGDILMQHQLHPTLLPVNEQSTAVFSASQCRVLHALWLQVNQEYQNAFYDCNPLVISGMDWGEASDLYTNMLTALNGIQPIGMTQFIFDQHGLLPAMGAVAEINAFAVVHLMAGKAMLNTGPVIAPLTTAKAGATVLKLRLEYDNGEFKPFEIKAGQLQKLPVLPGQSARIKLETLGATWLDVHRQARSADIKVTGGLFGALVDARLRPLPPVVDKLERMLQLQRWRQALELNVDDQSGERKVG